MGFTYGRGTLICQDCRGKKKVRNSKRCKPCNYKSKEWAEIHRESTKRRFEDPLERAKSSAAMKKSPDFHAVMKSKEHRETQRRYMKRRYEDPEERVKQSKVMKIVLNRPEVKEKQRKAATKRYENPAEHVKQSKVMKKRYEDPEEHARQSEAIRRGWKKRKQVHGNQIS